MNKTLLTLLFLSIISTSFGQSITNTPSVNGTINTIFTQGDTVYIGGNFTRVYDSDNSSWYGGVIDKTTGEQLNPKFRPDKSITCAISDGEGGYIIGGQFTHIGDSIRNGIAHIDSLGYVTEKLAGISITGTPYELLKRNDTLYIGGVFTKVNESGRSGIALVNINTCGVLPVVLNCSSVWVFKTDGNTLYVGGTFSTIANVSRSSIAAIDLATMTVLPFSYAVPSGKSVRAIEITDSFMFVGGSFNSFGSLSKSNLNAVTINRFTGAVTTLATQYYETQGTVNNIIAYGDTLIIGYAYYGVLDFYSISKRVDLAFSANIDLYDISINAEQDMLVDGSKLYLAGTSYNDPAVHSNSYAVFDLATGSWIPSWDPGALAYAYRGSALAMSGNTLFAGGNSPLIGGKRRNNIAAYLASTGKVLDCTPSVYGEVFAIHRYDSTLFIGGDFDSVSTSKRSGFVSVNASTGEINPLDINLKTNEKVYCMAGWDSLLFIGGEFNTVLNNHALYCINRITQQLLPAYYTNITGVGASIRNMKIAGNTLYMCGGFSFYFEGEHGLQYQASICALQLPSLTLKPWFPLVGSGYHVECIEPFEDKVFLGGYFFTINDTPRTYFAVVDTSTGALFPTKIKQGKPFFFYNKGSIIYAVCEQPMASVTPGRPVENVAAIDGHTLDLVTWHSPALAFPNTRALGAVGDNMICVGWGEVGNSASSPNPKHFGISTVQSDTSIHIDWLPGQNFCAGSSLRVSFSDMLLGAEHGNVFTIELSDSNGSFLTPTIIGTSNEQFVDWVLCKIPADIPLGSGYRMRITGSAPFRISEDNGTDLAIVDVQTTGFIVNEDKQCLKTNAFQFIDTSASLSGALTRVWKFSDNTTSTLVNPPAKKYTAAGDYMVKLVSNNTKGCIDSVTQYIHVLPQPGASISSPLPLKICEDDSAQLQANTGINYTYSWLKNGTLIQGPSTASNYYVFLAGAYSVMVTDTNNCSDTSASIVAEINPKPVKPVIEVIGHDTIAVTIEMTAYNWYKDNILIAGAHESYYILKETGYYTVEVINDLGCSNISDTFYADYTGVEEKIESDRMVHVFPNPAKDHLTFTMLVPFNSYDISMYAISGKQVFHLSHNTNRNLEIVLPPDVREGMYFVEVTLANHTVIRKKVIIANQ